MRLQGPFTPIEYIRKPKRAQHSNAQQTNRITEHNVGSACHPKRVAKTSSDNPTATVANRLLAPKPGASHARTSDKPCSRAKCLRKRCTSIGSFSRMSAKVPLELSESATITEIPFPRKTLNASSSVRSSPM